jgi:hypothetical protein
MTDLFYAPMRLLLERPYLALVPAFLFWLGYRRVRPRAAGWLLGPAVLWLLYAAYETYMFFWSRTVTAPIRIDLLLLAPVLYLATVVGLVAWWRAARAGARDG